MDDVPLKEGKRTSRYFPITIGCLFLISIPVIPLVLFIASEWPPPIEKRVSTFGPLNLEADNEFLQEIDVLIESHSLPERIYRKDIDGDQIEDTNDGTEVKVSSTPSVTYRFHGVSAPHSIGFDDINGDGLTDAWCYDPGDQVMRILWANQPGRFNASQRIPRISLGGKGAYFDVDNDGDLDIILKDEYQTKHHPTDRSPSGATVEYSWIKIEKRDPCRWKEETP